MYRSFLVVACAAATAALLSGCVPGNYRPNAGAATAELTLVRGAMHLGARSLQVYAGYRDAHCSAGPGNGRLAALLTYTKTEKTAAVEAGRRLYVVAGLRNYSVRQGTCLNIVSFVPQPQHRYEAIQDETARYPCTLRVVDRADGSPPPDLTVEDARNCPGKAVE